MSQCQQQYLGGLQDCFSAEVWIRLQLNGLCEVELEGYNHMV